jgi:hypothetical protein
MGENYPGGPTPENTTGEITANSNNTSDEINLSTPDRKAGLHEIVAFQWLSLYSVGDTAYNHVFPVSALAKIMSTEYQIRMEVITVLAAIKRDGRFKPKFVNGEWLIKAKFTVKRRRF